VPDPRTPKACQDQEGEGGSRSGRGRRPISGQRSHSPRCRKQTLPASTSLPKQGHLKGPARWALIDKPVVEQDRWSAVDQYVTDLLAPHDQVLDAALEESEKAGLPAIQVSPPQGKLLNLLAKTLEAKAILEFGTLGGYSTIWLARGLSEDGHLITLEIDPDFAAVARKNVNRAGMGDRVDLRTGLATALLADTELEKAGPFDLVFIDADKANSPSYFSWAVHHTRPGGLIVADNVVRGGALADGEDEDAAVRGQRTLHEMMAAESRVSATTIQTVGSKGYDGFSIALVTK
jgi:predicted O-methyltransferase YrrM